jgi:hypothetical protein
LTALQNTVANLEGQISTRDRTVCQLQAAKIPAPSKDTATAAPFPTVTTTTNPNHMSEQIPSPDKFNSTCSLLRSFLGEVRMKFIADQDWFQNKRSQIIYTLSLLEKNVVLMVAPLLDTSVLPCEKVDDPVTLLKTLYGEPACQASA